MIDKERIFQKLNALAIEHTGSLEVFDEIDSTNAEALRRIKEGALASRVILARSQSAGRGRRGRAWMSPRDAGIYLSVIKPVTGEGNSLQPLSLVVALAVVSALEGMKLQNLQLKWPNDVLVNRNKLAGILLETQAIGTNAYIVVGIGVNLALPEGVRSQLERPVTDLVSEFPGLVDASSVVAQLLNQLFSLFSAFELDGFAPFRARWNSLDRYRDQEVIVEQGELRRIGLCRGVDDEGGLLLQTANGLEQIRGGEVFPSLRGTAE